MNIAEKVSYIKGLVDGLKIDESNPEAKILLNIVDLLNDVSLHISALEDGYDDLADQVDVIDEDLNVLAEELYAENDEFDEEIFYEVTCPYCKEDVCVPESILLDGSIECPNCQKTLEFDLSDVSLKKCNCNHNCECES